MPAEPSWGGGHLTYPPPNGNILIFEEAKYLHGFSLVASLARDSRKSIPADAAGMIF